MIIRGNWELHAEFVLIYHLLQASQILVGLVVWDTGSDLYSFGLIDGRIKILRIHSYRLLIIVLALYVNGRLKWKEHLCLSPLLLVLLRWDASQPDGTLLMMRDLMLHGHPSWIIHLKWHLCWVIDRQYLVLVLTRGDFEVRMRILVVWVWSANIFSDSKDYSSVDLVRGLRSMRIDGCSRPIRLIIPYCRRCHIIRWSKCNIFRWVILSLTEVPLFEVLIMENTDEWSPAFLVLKLLGSQSIHRILNHCELINLFSFLKIFEQGISVPLAQPLLTSSRHGFHLGIGLIRPKDGWAVI